MKRSLIVSGILLLALSGCHISSKTVIDGHGGRSGYNVTLQKTNNEQMLLNIVRLRYVDFPFFLDVNTITTQFFFGTRVSPAVTIPGFSTENPAVLGGEFSWSNTPTITYTPLEGRSFASQLFHPIDLTIIQQLIYSGWDIDRVFRLTVQRIDELMNAPTASGPIPGLEPSFKKFFEMSRILRYFQLRGQLLVGVKGVQSPTKDKDEPIMGTSLQISLPTNNEEACKLARLFHSDHIEQNQYFFNLPLGFNDRGEIGIMPRSLMSCLYYVSLGVDVPKEHIRSGFAQKTQTEEGEVFDWKKVVGDLITIKSSKNKPERAYVAVHYSDYWFYIDTCDNASKRTFVLLMQLYNLQSKTIQQTPPVLTIPLGSG